MAETTVVDGEITALQIKVYDAIREAWEKGGTGPTHSELARALGCTTQAAHIAIKTLRRRGHITSGHYKSRSATPVDLERTIVRYEPKPWEKLIKAPRPEYFIFTED